MFAYKGRRGSTFLKILRTYYVDGPFGSRYHSIIRIVPYLLFCIINLLATISIYSVSIYCISFLAIFRQ